MSPRASHRLFIAVDPPPHVAAELTGWARAHRARGHGFRVMDTARIHLTLAFLGERPAHDVDPIAQALGGAITDWARADADGPVPLELAGPAWLPPRSPRALTVEVRDPTGRLRDLRTAVAAGLDQAVGWTDEHRRFRPHLTVGRVAARPDDLGPLEPTPAAAFTVGEAILYRSFLGPGGGRYEVLERVSLT